MAWLSSAPEKNYPNDDYRELLELTMIFLGSPPLGGIKFHAPGAVHHGRWMVKAIYAIEIWMFRSPFRLTRSGEKDCESYASSWPESIPRRGRLSLRVLVLLYLI